MCQWLLGPSKSDTHLGREILEGWVVGAQSHAGEGCSGVQPGTTCVRRRVPLQHDLAVRNGHKFLDRLCPRVLLVTCAQRAMYLVSAGWGPDCSSAARQRLKVLRVCTPRMCREHSIHIVGRT